MPKLWHHWFLMIPTFGPHDAKMMPKKTYQNQASRENKDAKTKTTLVSNDAFFGSQDAKIMTQKITKSRQHERQKMSKARHVSSLMMPGFGSQDAK